MRKVEWTNNLKPIDTVLCSRFEPGIGWRRISHFSLKQVADAMPPAILHFTQGPAPQ